MQKKPPRVLVVQDGARLHYALPRSLEREGFLDRVFTDFLVRPWSIEILLMLISKPLKSLKAKRMAERCCPEIERKTESFPLQSIIWQRRRSSFASDEDYYEWLAKKSAEWMLNRNFGTANTIIGFIRNLNPEFCAACQKKGLITVGDQMIAPAAIEHREMAAQVKRWPGWVVGSHLINDHLISVEKRSWEHLDYITCGSEYVRKGLLDCGVASEKVRILPYPSPKIVKICNNKNIEDLPLKIGFVGSVNLRKGAPIFLEIAKRLKTPKVEFIMVGPLAIPEDKISEMKLFVRLEGPVPRSEVSKFLHSFDIFFFPSCCEGSAGVVMEALAAGLSVVTTPNSGSVIRDGIDGYIHEVDDLNGMESSLATLISNQSIRERFRTAALSTAASFDEKSYSRKLGKFLSELSLIL